MNNLIWYEFTQNNSGGHFTVDDKVCHRVFIQSTDLDSACTFAESLGIYFNGVDDGHDCECCGDRWYKPYGTVNFPLEYTKKLTFNDIEEYAQYLANEYGWTIPDARLYYYDSDVKLIYKKKKNEG